MREGGKERWEGKVGRKGGKERWEGKVGGVDVKVSDPPSVVEHTSFFEPKAVLKPRARPPASIEYN